MPGLDGLSLVRAIRDDPRTQAVPVVLLSARAGEEARVDGLGAGADDYLVKPFAARELLARVGGAPGTPEATSSPPGRGTQRARRSRRRASTRASAPTVARIRFRPSPPPWRARTTLQDVGEAVIQRRAARAQRGDRHVAVAGVTRHDVFTMVAPTGYAQAVESLYSARPARCRAARRGGRAHAPAAVDRVGGGGGQSVPVLDRRVRRATRRSRRCP